MCFREWWSHICWTTFQKVQSSEVHPPIVLTQAGRKGHRMIVWSKKPVYIYIYTKRSKYGPYLSPEYCKSYFYQLLPLFSNSNHSTHQPIKNSMLNPKSIGLENLPRRIDEKMLVNCYMPHSDRPKYHSVAYIILYPSYIFSYNYSSYYM